MRRRGYAGEGRGLINSDTFEDFENHLGTIFTEIRLKQVIEFRSLDTCNFGCICNGPSFFTGLIYGSLEETYEIIKNWKPKDQKKLPKNFGWEILDLKNDDRINDLIYFLNKNYMGVNGLYSLELNKEYAFSFPLIPYFSSALRNLL